MRLFEQRCIVCSEKQPSGRTCSPCREDTPLTGALSAGPYAAPYLRRGISWLKFRSVKDVAPALAYLTLPHLSKISPITTLQKSAVFVPIPLHARREHTRGFNQAEEIARALQGYVHISVLQALARPKATHTQARLPNELRKQNITDAFSVIQDIPPATTHVILVDDVTTSGNTISAAAMVLRPSLPSRTQMWGLTVARG